MTQATAPVPIAVNFHLYKPCNYRCRFCFATYRDIDGHLPLADAKALLRALREAGAEKLNFAGGEPTLHPQIGELVAEAKALGFVTTLITNGARLDLLLDHHAHQIDWVGISVDSGIEQIQAELGRGRGAHVERSRRHAARVHALGIGLKLNTVVTALNWQEDMHALLRELRPARWKVFQVLAIAGQNDGDVEPLLIDRASFRAFVDRHQDLAAEGLGPVAEDNDAMTDSYAMIDPLGRFYGNHGGRYVYSPPILEVGVAAALAHVDFEVRRLIERGGLYLWRR
ncbi:MAG: radical SAM protein [Nannocystis sp.]|jgi:radical S-adenosyl methionine domain-containing protein 2|nr:radical SAM protein [Nannocystis sp.]